MSLSAYAIESMAYMTSAMIDLGEADCSLEAAMCKVDFILFRFGFNHTISLYRYHMKIMIIIIFEFFVYVIA